MSEQSPKNDSSKSFKIIIAVLSLTILCSLFYLYISSANDRNEIVNLRKEKSVVLKDLEKSKLFLDQILTSNKSLSNKLILEREKVSKLISDLSSKTVTTKTLIVYKKDANFIDARIKTLLEQINVYKNRIDSTNVVLKIEKVKNDTLTNNNKKLISKVSEASKLYFYNLKSNFFKVKSSGREIETDNASRIDLIKVSFMIAENDFAKNFKKVYYVQIIDPKNNVIGRKESQRFGDFYLEYGALIPVQFEKKTVKGEADIAVKDLVYGDYKINIFDKSKIILTESFKLK